MRVSELCFGTMTFGGEGIYQAIGSTAQADADESSAPAGRWHQLLRHGRHLLDRRAEEILGRALGARRKEVIVATKVRGRVGAGPNEVGLSRGHIMDSIDGSLRRLGTDYIDLYQIHGFDAWTPWEETLRALDDLVRPGKVRYLGASNLAAWQLMKALGVSERQGLERFETIQSYYSIAGRDLEREVVPLMKSEQVGLLSGARWPAAFWAGSFRPTRRSPPAPAAPASTSRRSTRRAATPCWRRSARWRASWRSPSRGWRSPGCFIRASPPA